MLTGTAVGNFKLGVPRKGLEPGNVNFQSLLYKQKQNKKQISGLGWERQSLRIPQNPTESCYKSI